MPLPQLKLESSERRQLGGEFVIEATLRPSGDKMGPAAAGAADEAAAAHMKAAGWGSDFWLPSLRRGRQWSPPVTPRLPGTGAASPADQSSLLSLPPSAAVSRQSQSVAAASQPPVLPHTAPGSSSVAAAGAAHAAGLSPSPRGGRSTALERLKAAQLLSPIPARRQTDQQPASAPSPPPQPPRRISEPGAGRGSSSRSGTPAATRPAAANAALHNLKLRRQASIVANQLFPGTARPKTAPS
jgi:hypothetical protein